MKSLNALLAEIVEVLTRIEAKFCAVNPEVQAEQGLPEEQAAKDGRRRFEELTAIRKELTKTFLSFEIELVVHAREARKARYEELKQIKDKWLAACDTWRENYEEFDKLESEFAPRWTADSHEQVKNK